MIHKGQGNFVSNGHVLGYRCSVCHTFYGLDEVTYSCPADNGNLDLVYDYQKIRTHLTPSQLINNSDFSIWRYAPLLPVTVPDASRTPLGVVGCTPLYKPEGLKKKTGLRNLWIKDESTNPTASFKDRASAVVVKRAQEIGADVVCTASTGNAGAALAGMAAAVGQKAVIFAPRNAPPAKVAQLHIYGAKVILVDGTYDDAFDLSLEACQEFGWYCRNTGYNPFTAEGKKTAAFEIWEKLILSGISDKKPLNIFVSVGDGNIIAGIHKGFKDLMRLGLIEHYPRLYGIQAEGSAAIANAFKVGNEDILSVSANTLADSISVDMPKDGLRGLRAATETDGAYLTVRDKDILNAIADLGSAGIFAEPAGATAYAGLVKAAKEGIIKPDCPTLVLNTGSGLKDVKAAQQSVGDATVITPTLKAVEIAMRGAWK